MSGRSGCRGQQPYAPRELVRVGSGTSHLGRDMERDPRHDRGVANERFPGGRKRRPPRVDARLAAVAGRQQRRDHERPSPRRRPQPLRVSKRIAAGRLHPLYRGVYAAETAGSRAERLLTLVVEAGALGGRVERLAEHVLVQRAPLEWHDRNDKGVKLAVSPSPSNAQHRPSVPASRGTCRIAPTRSSRQGQDLHLPHWPKPDGLATRQHALPTRSTSTASR
jgi:hypothetical protein